MCHAGFISSSDSVLLNDYITHHYDQYVLITDPLLTASSPVTRHAYQHFVDFQHLYALEVTQAFSTVRNALQMLLAL